MSKPILADHDFGGVARILNLLDAIGAQEPVTLAQLRAAIEGLNWKDNVRVAASTNVNLASPGAAINGITMVLNDRFLARAETSHADDGIYIWNGAATPATRAADANTIDELRQAIVTVDEGSDAGTSWRQENILVTLGTTVQSWVAFGTVTPQASTTVQGKIEIATQPETDAGTDPDRAVTPATLAGYSGRKLKFSADVGDGSATSYTITHNLGTRDVVVMVRKTSGNFDEVICDVLVKTTNSIDLVFATAPASAAYRVIILG